MAAELIPTLGAELVTASGVRAGRRVLDVAAGSGNAAIPAAETGADVTASDLTPELFDAGRRIATEHGVGPEWVEADAEREPANIAIATRMVNAAKDSSSTGSVTRWLSRVPPEADGSERQAGAPADEATPPPRIRASTPTTAVTPTRPARTAPAGRPGRER